MKALLLSFFLITACSNPFDGRGKLIFRDINQDALKEVQKAERDRKEEWATIERDAQNGFEELRPLLTRKCFDCHDSNTRLPLYGRIFPGINPVHKHQVEGLKALDFGNGYPMAALGSPTQLSLLKSIRNVTLDRSMPLKSYVTVYRKRKITEEDQAKILAWVDPIIERIEEFDERYSEDHKSAEQILDQKCFRCHAQGANRGGFGDMEKKETLFKSKYVNIKDPAASIIYTISHEGKMPPNKRDALTHDELITIREWLIQESVKFQ